MAVCEENLMRRRHSSLMSLADAMGIRQCQWNGRFSRFCLFAALAALIWIYLLFFNLVAFGGNRVAYSSPRFESVSLSDGKSIPKFPGSNPSSVSRSLNVHRPDIYKKAPDTAARDGIVPNRVKSRGSKFPIRIRNKPNHGMNMADYPFMRALRAAKNQSDPCGGRYVYVHKLPSRFNDDMLRECRSISPWTDMCKFIANHGLGPPLENIGGVFSEAGWYSTNQFALDVIFSNRMKTYECLTNDSSIAAAVFVPFYAGFDISRYLWGHNISTRDAAARDLIDWLMKRPEWSVMGGKDHFLVGGRITWDFRRVTDQESDWGSKFLFFPAAKNMSMLVVESSPWHLNDYAIPYPTYFHPVRDADVLEWQGRMTKMERKYLFCFAGAPRPGLVKSIRSQIINQCKNSKACKLLDCGTGESNCYSPSSIMQMFQSSVFCLQPQGDSYTRRSTFDAILAGCIPVFFHPGSSYTEYTWHLPKNYSKYSVFIPEDHIRKNVSIEQRLKQISAKNVKDMRDAVISLIPSITYADPRSKLETFKDAFDIAVHAIIDKVTKLRKDMIKGRHNDNIIEALSWKYAILDEDRAMQPHEWDRFFSKQKNDS